MSAVQVQEVGVLVCSRVKVVAVVVGSGSSCQGGNGCGAELAQL